MNLKKALKEALAEESETTEKIKESLLSPMMMLDGKIQKLIMLLDQYIDDSRILRIKPGIDEKLDALQDEIDDYLEKFAEKQADAAEILGLPPTGRLEISLVL